jgi:hypothetical protein
MRRNDFEVFGGQAVAEFNPPRFPKSFVDTVIDSWREHDDLALCKFCFQFYAASNSVFDDHVSFSSTS